MSRWIDLLARLSAVEPKALGRWRLANGETFLSRVPDWSAKRPGLGECQTRYAYLSQAVVLEFARTPLPHFQTTHDLEQMKRAASDQVGFNVGFVDDRLLIVADPS